MSAQERLLYNNNYNSNHHHNNTNNIISTNSSGGANSGSSMTNSNQNLPPLAMTNLDEENHYQLPYAHLHPQQSPYLPHHHNHLVQAPPTHLVHQPHHHQGSYSSGDEHSSTYGGVRPPGNGHGGCSVGVYPHDYPTHFGTLQDKYSVAYPVRNEGDGMMGRRGNRNTGSGLVYRPRRKLWWAAVTLALALLLIAGAVVIVVYFTVLTKDNEPAKVMGQGGSGSGDQGNHGSGGSMGGDFVTGQPPYIVPGTSKAPLDGSDQTDNGGQQPGSKLSRVTRFEAYWHPGDSRLFTAHLANGSSVEVFGPKKSDGTIKSIYSVGLKDSKADQPSSKSVVRFQGGLNIASVVLPNGVVVNYDWSVDKQHLEVQVFQPYMSQTTEPISYLAKVASSLLLYPLRQIHNVLERIPHFSAVSSTGGRGRLSSKCFSRFPVMVNKCGGKFPYDGAYVQGEISRLGSPIMMAALPWPKEANDPCYAQDAGSAFNFYLPLPGVVDSDNATMIKEAYVASSAKIFYHLCNVVKQQDHAERHKVCSNVAEKVRADLNEHHVMDSVYASCSAIMNSLFTMCAAVHDIASSENMPSISENVMLRSFQRRISDSFPRDLPEFVQIKAHAFCPSSQPQSSYQKTVGTGTIRGNVVEDAIHIDCGNFPEITYVDMNHMLALSGQQYDVIKHKIRMCSICAFEMEVSAQIIKEEMLCNNTCTKKSSAANNQDDYSRETKTFNQQDSVYCTDFLTSVDNSIEPIGRNCLANCMSDLKVQIQIRDPERDLYFYKQVVKCSELQKSRCTMKFGK